MDNHQSLIDRKVALIAEQRKLLDSADPARGLTADQQAAFAAMDKDLNNIEASISAFDGLARRQSAASAQRDSNFRPSLPGSEDEDDPRAKFASKDYKKAFNALLRSRGVVTSLRSEVVNVLQTGVDQDGGFTVPTTLEAAIMPFVYQNDPLRSLATVMNLNSDTSFTIQTGEAEFDYIGENGAYGQTTPTVGRVTLSAHKVGGAIYVSEELLKDSAANIIAFITQAAGRAFGKRDGADHISGNGAGRPLGIFSTTSVGGITLSDTTGATNATPTITGDNVIDTFHSLLPQYRARAAWLAHDSLIKILRKLKNSNGDYIYLTSLVAGQPDTLMGKPIYVSEFAPTPAANTRSLAFGEFSNYFIADRLGSTMRRFDELGAMNGQVIFRFTRRSDARLKDGNSVVFYKHGAAS